MAPTLVPPNIWFQQKTPEVTRTVCDSRIVYMTAEPLVTRGQRGKLGVLRTTHCIAPSDTASASASAIASASASASANVPGNLVCSLPLPRVTLLVRPAGLPGMRKVVLMSTPLVDQHQLLQHKLQTE